MASNLTDFPIKSFVGGLNTYANKSQVGDNESPAMMNMDFSGIQAIKKASGYQKLTTNQVVSGKRVRAVTQYVTDTTKDIMYIADTSLYKYDGSGGSTAIGGAASALTSDLDTFFVQVADRLVILNGTDSLRYYDGSGVITTGVTAAPTSSTLGVNFNRRLYVNSTVNKDRVYFSSPLTATGASTSVCDFTDNPAGTLYGGFFGYGVGKQVMGLVVQPNNNNALYVFLKDEIHRIVPTYGSGVATSTSHADTIISKTTGCRATKSCIPVNNDIYFLDYDGIKSLGEVATYSSVRTTPLSGKITSLIQSIISTQFSRATAVFHNQRYYLSVSQSGSANSDVLIYDTRYKAWLRWNFMVVSDWLSYEDSNGARHLYFSSDDTTKGRIYEAEQTTNADGSAISAYYHTKEFDLKAFDVSKLFFYWSIFFGPLYGVVSVSTFIDGTEYSSNFSVGSSSSYSDGIGSLPLGTFPFGLEQNSPDTTSSVTPQNDFRRHDLDSVDGYRVQLYFANATVGEQFQVEQAKIAYKALSPRKIDSSKEV